MFDYSFNLSRQKDPYIPRDAENIQRDGGDYKDHILSTFPKAQWQQPNTPIKKFVDRAQGNS